MPRRLLLVLDTPGGVVEAVEKMVEIIRHHFDEVFFAVPRAAMSAGTIFCMSGDRIYMDYTSSLGPIDPQVSLQNGQFVPALGYIDKVEELIEKSREGSLTNAELIMLQKLDLATLRRYEQARDLSVSLLKQWLVQYKFKDWVTHGTTTPGSPVTADQKQARAEQIAKDLSDNRRWHSHGRTIGINTLFFFITANVKRPEMILELQLKKTFEKEIRKRGPAERENLARVSAQFDSLVANGLIIPEQYVIEPTNPSSPVFSHAMGRSNSQTNR